MSELAVGSSVPPGTWNGAAASEEEFVRLFNSVRTELVSTLFFVLGNYADAQDAAQDAFLKCWRARQTLPEVRDTRAWIFRIGLNAAKDLQRSAWRRKAKPLSEAVAELAPAPGVSPAEAVQDKETLDGLRDALLELRADEKEVFLLRQNADLTYEQIAELRRSPVGTVKTQMRSALHKLKRILKGK